MTTPLHLRQSEAQFQQAVIEYAQARGWLVHAERPARSDKGWRTPVMGDAGFPDVVLAKGGVVWLWELKAQDGKATEYQQQWFIAAKPIAHILRPSDWPWIEEVLS